MEGVSGGVSSHCHGVISCKDEKKYILQLVLWKIIAKREVMGK